MNMIEETKEFEASYLKSLNENINSRLEIKSIDQDLKEVEQIFRDPQLLIQKFEDINLNKKEAIAKLQLKMNTMSQVKDDLKASFDFKPNLSFSKDLFGQLNLGKCLSFDLIKSQILIGQQSSEIIKLCEFYLKDKFKLLYRASRDGFASTDFHSKCDGHANTLGAYLSACT